MSLLHEGLSSKMSTNMDRFFQVPITTRGLFSKDDTFRRSRSRLSSIIKDIMTKSGEQDVVNKDHDDSSDFFNSDMFNSYRTLRQRDHKEDKQAAFVTKEDNINKVVIDVKDFINGKLSVKTVGNTQLVVEGVQEVSDGTPNRRFKRVFTFPVFNEGHVSTILSTDGILTINIPILDAKRTVKVPIQSSEEEPIREVITSKVTTQKQTTIPSGGQTATIPSEECSNNINKECKETIKERLNENIHKTTDLDQRSPRKDSWYEDMLHINNKGSFFNDSFFDDIRQDFHSALKNSLSRWDGSRSSDDLCSYRNMRTKDIKEDNQAVATKEDQHTLKIALDVYDFKEGDLKVKAVSDNELVVEGCVEKGDGTSVSNHSFKRSFHMPGLIDHDSITSALSSDGILTINVPKKIVAIDNTHLAGEKKELSAKSHDNMTETIVGGHTESKKVSQQLTSEISETEKQKTEILKDEKERRKIQISNETDFGRLLPINLTNNHFWNRTSAQKEQDDFFSSVKGILDTWGQPGSLANDMKSYRILRSQSLCEENQATKVSEDDTQQKIMVDVHDFTSGGDLTVKVISDDELVVEGRVNKKDGSTSSDHSFKRHFCLPGLVKHDSITSVLSSDGILTITVPKKEIRTINKGFIIPIKSIKENRLQEISKTSVVQKSEASTIPSKSPETVLKKNEDIILSVDNQNGRVVPVVCETDKTVCLETTLGGKTVPIVCNADNLTTVQVSKKEIKIESSPQIEIEKNVISENKQNSQSTKTITETQATQKCGVTSQTQTSEEKSSSCVQLEETPLNSHNHSNMEQLLGTKSTVTTSDNMNVNDIIGSILPIVEKGNFFTDSFFENSRNYFQSAVNNILTKWGNDLEISDPISSYRDLRIRDLKEENQAVSLTEEDDHHKIVMDVQAFKDGVVKVRAISSKEFIVEGCTERETETSKSRQSFRRCFCLPNVIDIGAVTSAMSSDGILTIIAPKKLTNIKQIDEHGVVKELKQITTPSSQLSEIQTKTDQGAIKESKRITSVSKSLTVQEDNQLHTDNNKGRIVPLVCDKIGDSKTQIQIEEMESKCYVPIESEQKNTSDEEVETIITKKRTETKSVTTMEQGKQKDLKNDTNEAEKQLSTETSNLTSCKQLLTDSSSHCENIGSITHKIDSIFPIVQKGNFFTDSFFESSRNHFQSSIKDILSKCLVNWSNSDEINSYRDLRIRDLKEDNQAVSVIEEEHQHKIVIDVQAFKEGEVKIRAVSSNEFIVEGCTEKQTDSSKSRHSFRRSFCLPNVIDTEAVTSALSSDGILTIIAPKKTTILREIDAEGTVKELKQTTVSQGASGSTWEEGHQECIEGEGYSKKTSSKTFHSEYQSP